MKKIFSISLILNLLLMPMSLSAFFNRDLVYKSSGTEIKELQKFLAEQKLYAGPISGRFSALTKNALKAFQKREGIKPASGFLGIATRRRINSILSASIKDTNTLLLEKHESWGPCPNPDGGCFLNTYVYRSGKVVFKNKMTLEKNLDQLTIGRIIQKIRDSNLMKKDCGDQTVLDYSARYKFLLDGQTKIIRFPNCESELKEIDTLLPAADFPQQGGV